MTEMAKKRGRPRKNGVKPDWMLLRLAVTLEAYDRARLAGAIYTRAIQAAMRAVHAEQFSMRISETEVKRLLAEFRSPRAPEVFMFSRIERGWAVSVGPRPPYPSRRKPQRSFIYSARYQRA